MSSLEVDEGTVIMVKRADTDPVHIEYSRSSSSGAVTANPDLSRLDASDQSALNACMGRVDGDTERYEPYASGPDQADCLRALESLRDLASRLIPEMQKATSIEEHCVNKIQATETGLQDLEKLRKTMSGDLYAARKRHLHGVCLEQIANFNAAEQKASRINDLGTALLNETNRLLCISTCAHPTSRSGMAQQDQAAEKQVPSDVRAQLEGMAVAGKAISDLMLSDADMDACLSGQLESFVDHVDGEEITYSRLKMCFGEQGGLLMSKSGEWVSNYLSKYRAPSFPYWSINYVEDLSEAQPREQHAGGQQKAVERGGEGNRIAGLIKANDTHGALGDLSAATDRLLEDFTADRKAIRARGASGDSGEANRAGFDLAFHVLKGRRLAHSLVTHVNRVQTAVDTAFSEADKQQRYYTPAEKALLSAMRTNATANSHEHKLTLMKSARTIADMNYETEEWSATVDKAEKNARKVAISRSKSAEWFNKARSLSEDERLPDSLGELSERVSLRVAQAEEKSRQDKEAHEYQKQLRKEFPDPSSKRSKSRKKRSVNKSSEPAEESVPPVDTAAQAEDGDKSAQNSNDDPAATGGDLTGDTCGSDDDEHDPDRGDLANLLDVPTLSRVQHRGRVHGPLGVPSDSRFQRIMFGFASDEASDGYKSRKAEKFVRKCLGGLSLLADQAAEVGSREADPRAADGSNGGFTGSNVSGPGDAVLRKAYSWAQAPSFTPGSPWKA